MIRGLRTTIFGAVVAALLACAPGASALETVLQDDAQLLHRPDADVRRSLEELRALGVDRIRVTAGWSVLTRDPDSKIRPLFDATDPAAYEQQRFANLDQLIRLATEAGFKTMLDVAFWAPKWASADSGGDRGRTDIDADAYGQFAEAIARRYSGVFAPPPVPVGTPAPAAGSDARLLAAMFGAQNRNSGTTLLDEYGAALTQRDPSPYPALTAQPVATPPPLPRVDVFTLWNEPNFPAFLRPQWVRRGKRFVPASPHLYRRMVQAAYPKMKHWRPDATVLIGGTSFTGAYNRRGTGGVPPLRFLRELACVDARLRPLNRGECADFAPVPGDGWAHHPYSLKTPPGARSRATRQDDVPISELPKLAAWLDRLVAAGRLSPGARDIWITEYGYETNPPARTSRFSPGDQAKFLPWAEYLAWRVPSVRSFAQFLLRDVPPQAARVGKSEARPFGQWQTGLLFADGRPKLATETFRAGLFAQAVRSGRMRVWGRLRTGDGQRTVALEWRRPHGRWSPLATVAPGAHGAASEFPTPAAGVFERFTKAPPRGARIRLRYLDGERWRATPSVAVVKAD